MARYRCRDIRIKEKCGGLADRWERMCGGLSAMSTKTEAASAVRPMGQERRRSQLMNQGYSNGNQFEAQGSSQARPFSIRIFCPDGNPVGLRIISKSNWTGCGLVCPRSILPAVKKSRKEFSQPGVYVLVGPPENGELPKIYVGEGDPLGPRLEQHYANKEFWTWAIFFVSKIAAEIKLMSSI
jgi:hypothetical protein